jgi:hypothetical protein
MQLAGLLISVGCAAIAFAGVARADTIFDVEHARADYRAGLTSEYDAELLRRWGAPSGYYPDSRLYRRPPYRYHPRKRHLRSRRW